MMVSFETEKLLFEKFFNKFSFLKETDNQKIHLMTFMNHGKSGKPLSNLLWKYYVQAFSFNLRSHAQSSVIYKFVGVSKIWWYYERHCVFFRKKILWIKSTFFNVTRAEKVWICPELKILESKSKFFENKTSREAVFNFLFLMSQINE